MVDRELVARLDAGRVKFCLIGDRALVAHGCAPRDGDVELLAVDPAVLRPLFWAAADGPRITIGQPDDAVEGRVRWQRVPDHVLLVGSVHPMVFAVDTARPLDGAPCPVATPLALILLALSRGGPGSRADVVELIRAQQRRRDGRWRPKVEDHLRFLPEAAEQSWLHVLRDLDGR
jgi:hypothetical protein